MNRKLRFLLAKYTPDLRRMEPVNLGLLLFGDDGVALSRFLGEQSDGRLKVPSIVERADKHAFREWIDFWKYHIESGRITTRTGEVVESSSPRFVEALREKSKEQFRLVESGEITVDAGPGVLRAVLDEFFERLVTRPTADSKSGKRQKFATACDRVMYTSGTINRSDFTRDLSIVRSIRGVERSFVARFAFGSADKPEVVIQPVSLKSRMSVDSSAFMFDALLLGRNAVPRENCAALVSVASIAEDDDGLSGLRLLEAMVPIIDVGDDKAAARVSEMVERIGHQPI